MVVRPRRICLRKREGSHGAESLTIENGQRRTKEEAWEPDVVGEGGQTRLPSCKRRSVSRVKGHQAVDGGRTDLWTTSPSKNIELGEGLQALLTGLSRATTAELPVPPLLPEPADPKRRSSVLHACDSVENRQREMQEDSCCRHGIGGEAAGTSSEGREASSAGMAQSLQPPPPSGPRCFAEVRGSAAPPLDCVGPRD